MSKILIDEATVKLARIHKTTGVNMSEMTDFYPAPVVPVQEQVGRTDQQIVNQTEELAVWLLKWGFNLQPETPTPMRESRHPIAERCWSAACHIQEMLTATDPENSVAELDDAPQAQPAQRKPLTDEQIDELARTMVKGSKSVNWLCRAIEAAHGIKEKNA